MEWMKKCYSRLLIDNHITDLKPEFMRRFDPAEYVRMVKTAGVDSAMIYACCHNGNCYYPTKVGHMHANLDGRDIFGETVAGLNAAGITPIAYYTIVFHNDSAKNHQAWRMQDINGKQSDGRYWYSCINNSDYVSFVKQQLSEISVYPLAGVFIDMTFWPLVCYCQNCRSKYRTETGREIPETIDWSNPEWVTFQRRREAWMAEAAGIFTAHVKSVKPSLSVTHNFAPVLHGWLLGQAGGVAAAADYASGDFYGGKHQQRLGCKVFAAYTSNMPYEFMTSRCVTLYDHTSMKSEDELFMYAATTLSNAGAYFFIDAINPDGSLNDSVYQSLGKVVSKLKPFTNFIQRHQPELSADCGLYFSAPANVNPAINGVSLKSFSDKSSHMTVTSENSEKSLSKNTGRSNVVMEECVGTSVILGKMKIPYRVITETSPSLDGLKTLIVNNVAYLSPAEIERIRAFVRDGGTLIATGITSLYDLYGNSAGDFQLADVLGVNFTGRYSDEMNYLEFSAGRGRLISCSGPAPLVNTASAEVLGYVVEPYFPFNDPEKYASIHSNPPGIKTAFPGLTVNSFGKGRAVYLYSSLLKHLQYSQETFGRELFKQFVAPVAVISHNLPDCVELTILKSTTQNSWIVCLVNYQDELPGIPIHDLRFTIQLPAGFNAKTMTRVSDGQTIEFAADESRLNFAVTQLNNIEIIEIIGG
jgi:hypothetical protein